jgi:hypothetical protein
MIVLVADADESGPSCSDAATAEGLEVGRATVEMARDRFVEGASEAALDPGVVSQQYERGLGGKAMPFLWRLALRVRTHPMAALG